MRINKFLRECGLWSRREADFLVSEGRVTADGAVCHPGSQVDDRMVVCVDGEPVHRVEEKSYYLYYKPVGVVCTFEERERDNLRMHLQLPVRVTYAGRLDRDSEGLLLLTDDGDLIESLMHARAGHEKEYEVIVDRSIPDEALEKMEQGVFLSELQVTTLPCRTERIDATSFRIVLTQGLNRQIRRMCKEMGAKVTRLVRVRIANLFLGDLAPGEVRKLTEEEVAGLRQVIERE